MDAQIAIRGGSVIDGTGAPARRADVGVADGRVVEIAEKVTAPREIDATGRLVTPGFVDIHTHYDPQVLWDPSLSPSCWHGVTSVVAGNCGYSIAPTRPADRASLLRTLDKVEDMRLATLEAGVEWDFETYGEYLDAVARRGTVINFGGYVGHTPVRLYVLGDDAYERKATDDEIIRMKQVVADSLNGGALGFSSDRGGFHIGDGGRPVPSIMASQEETEALMRVTGEINRGMIHIAPGENYEWVYDFQKSLGRTITWSSILTYPPEWKSRAPFKGKLDRHTEGRRGGADVWVQVTCRPIVQQISMHEPTPFYQMPAFADLVATPMADRPSLYRDPSWRARVYDEFESSKWINPGWETFTVNESQAHPELEGRSLASIARDRGCTPFDVLADVALDDNLKARFEVTFANNDEAGITMLVQSEGCIMGLSDAGAHISQICDAVMPTDFLSSWVRDREVMPIERGVRKLTGEIADVIGVDRGYIRVGSPADIVVLDLEQLSTGPLRRVHDMPADGERLVADAPTGIDAVLVNGTPIRLDGKPIDHLLEELPGAVLRSVAGKGALMKVGVSLFMQNYTDWLRFEGIERGDAVTPIVIPDSQIYEEDLRLGKLVEPLGFDSLWSVEHHFTPYTMVPDVLKLLSYFAGCTERIEMGTMVIVLPWHDPIRVAEGIATLDNMLSGRRLSIGFGRGLGRREFGALRVPMEESRERFIEALDIVRTALSDEWFSYDGQFTNIPRTTLRPQPRSSGAQLIENMYCAWGSPQTIPIAAQTGLKALFIPQTTWDDYAVQMAKFRDLRAQAGFAPAHPTIALWVYCAKDEQAAAEGAQQYIPQYADSARRHYEIASTHFETTKGYEHYAAGSKALREAADPDNMGQMYLNNQVWGTPEQCIEKIARINELMGPDHFVCIMRYGSMPIGHAEASMRLFAQEVLPVVQQMTPAPVATAVG